MRAIGGSAIGAGLSVLMLLCAPARAGERPMPALGEERFVLELGYSPTSFDKRIRIDSKRAGVGTAFSLEDDLGFDADEGFYRIDADLRIARRHRLHVGYQEVDRHARRVLARDIRIEDTVFPVSVEVRSDEHMTTGNLSYAYSFWQNDRFELAALIGAYYLEWAFGVSVAGGLLAERVETQSPLPVVGIGAQYALTPRWLLDARTQYFSLETDEHDGSLRDTRLGLRFFATPNLGLGLSYDLYRLRVRVDDDRLLGRLDWHEEALVVSAVLRF